MNGEAPGATGVVVDGEVQCFHDGHQFVEDMVAVAASVGTDSDVLGVGDSEKSKMMAKMMPLDCTTLLQ